MLAIGIGSIDLRTGPGVSKPVSLVLRNCLHIPDLRQPLISVRKLGLTGFQTIFDADSCSINHLNPNKNIQGVVRGGVLNNLYRIPMYPRSVRLCPESTFIVHESPDLSAVPENRLARLSNPSPGSLNIWHRRFGHLNENDVRRLLSANIVEGRYLLGRSPSIPCEGCALAKSSVKPFPK